MEIWQKPQISESLNITARGSGWIGGGAQQDESEGGWRGRGPCQHCFSCWGQSSANVEAIHENCNLCQFVNNILNNNNS